MEYLFNFVLENFIFVMLVIILLSMFLKVMLQNKKNTLLTREASSFREMLEFSPDAFFVWLYDNNKKEYQMASRKLAIVLGLPSGRNTEFAEVLEKLESTNELSNSVEILNSDDERFFVEVKAKNKDRYFLCEGSNIVTFSGDKLAKIIWFKDISEKFLTSRKNLETLYNLENEKNYYQTIINALPFPLWIRDDGQLISDCNENYVKSVDMPNKESVTSNHIELGQGPDVQEIRGLSVLARKQEQPQQGVFPIILNSELRKIEINEAIIDENKTVGWARELSATEDEFGEVSQQNKLYQKAFDNYPMAVMIMDIKLNIIYYNLAFLEIWGIDEEFVSAKPNLNEFLGELKRLRKLPENRDFPLYKEQTIKFYKELQSNYSDTVYLPEAVIIKRTIAPLENGATISYFEDISYLQGLESKFYTLSENYKLTLDNIPNAVVIFGDNGRLKTANNAFLRLWGLEISDIENLLLSEVLDYKKKYFDKKYNWVDVKSEMLSHMTSGTKQIISMERNDNRHIDCTCIRLKDGGVMLSYNEAKA